MSQKRNLTVFLMIILAIFSFFNFYFSNFFKDMVHQHTVLSEFEISGIYSNNLILQHDNWSLGEGESYHIYNLSNFDQAKLEKLFSTLAWSELPINPSDSNKIFDINITTLHQLPNNCQSGFYFIECNTNEFVLSKIKLGIFDSSTMRLHLFLWNI